MIEVKVNRNTISLEGDKRDIEKVKYHLIGILPQKEQQAIVDEDPLNFTHSLDSQRIVAKVMIFYKDGNVKIIDKFIVK